MKLLTLVRHAESDRHPELADRDRPLSANGRRAAAEMARRWQRRGLVPDLLLTSPALRAASTARLFAHEFGIDAADIRIDDRIYPGSAGDLLDTIHAAAPAAAHLMLFGHNPGISELARLLCPALPLFELPPAGACTIAGAAAWTDFENAVLELRACERP